MFKAKFKITFYQSNDFNISILQSILTTPQDKALVGPIRKLSFSSFASNKRPKAEFGRKERTS